MPVSPTSPCPPKSRYVPKAIASQRGLDPNRRHREDLSPVRFAMLPSPQVCVPAVEGHVGRTSCYHEHSARRKNCPLLSLEGMAVPHEPGLYLTGLPPYSTSLPGGQLVIGPYPKGRMDVGMKKVPFEDVFGRESDPDTVAPLFVKEGDATLPSAKSLKDFEANVRSTSNVRRCLSSLEERISLLTSLQRRCARDDECSKASRKLLKNVFFFSMYCRGWGGPGTPFPISSLGGAVLSDDLRGWTARVTPSGEIDSGEDEDAEEERGGRLVGMMRLHLRAAFLSVDSLQSEEKRLFLTDHLLTAIPQSTTDGSRWPSRQRLFDCLFGCESGEEEDLVRLSVRLLHTCEMLSTYTYKTSPQWMKYEGDLTLA